MSDSIFVPVPRRWWEIPQAERRAASRLAASPPVATEASAGAVPAPRPESSQPERKSTMQSPKDHEFMKQARARAAEQRISMTRAMSQIVAEHPDLHRDFLAVSRMAPKRAS